MPVLNVDALIDERVNAIASYHRATGLHRAELDLSGGVDSAVMAGLLVLALGPAATTMVYSSINSGTETQGRARALGAALGVSLVVHDLTPTYTAMVADMLDNLVSAGLDRTEIETSIANDPTILGSIRSCLRAPLGRGYLRMTGNGLRHGTGNECEDRWLRFYQKGGDGEVDSNPIAMLAKGEVYQLAYGLGSRLSAAEAFASIIAAPPTPELWGAKATHTDEDEIGQYLGLTAHKHRFYSYIDLSTGHYSSLGLIERVSRFADTKAGAGLFDDETPNHALSAMIASAVGAAVFAEVDAETVAGLLHAARRTERTTRHKFNPNIPTMGDRTNLLEAGILTNTLPTF